MFLGELFAQAPIDHYPDIAVETVTDSSRYFVIRIQDGNGEKRFLVPHLEFSSPKGTLI